MADIVYPMLKVCGLTFISKVASSVKAGRTVEEVKYRLVSNLLHNESVESRATPNS